MKKITLALAAVLISGAAAPQVFAQPNTAKTPSTAASWLKQPSSNDWLASHLKGLNVYNDQNQKLGSIDELIMDSQGKVEAAVLDVGGFLGMGVHRVAVPFDQLHFTNQHPANVAANPAANPNGVGAANPGLGNPATTATPTTANTANSTAGSTTGTMARNDNVPDHATLNMTADQLKAAPEFHYNS